MRLHGGARVGRPEPPSVRISVCRWCLRRCAFALALTRERVWGIAGFAPFDISDLAVRGLRAERRRPELFFYRRALGLLGPSGRRVPQPSVEALRKRHNHHQLWRRHNTIIEIHDVCSAIISVAWFLRKLSIGDDGTGGISVRSLRKRCPCVNRHRRPGSRDLHSSDLGKATAMRCTSCFCQISLPEGRPLSASGPQVLATAG